MLATTSFLALALGPAVALAAEAHGASAQGTVMGPVAFMFPPDRPWSSASDNTAPCGSSAGITNRTAFPLGSVGAVSFTIADDAYNIALRIAYGNNPTAQSDFTTLRGNVSAWEEGHQCLPVVTPGDVKEGSNATIQMEYWANDGVGAESFYACADVTFIPSASFNLASIPCFNVTSADFELASPSTSSSVVQSMPTATASPDAPAPATVEKGSGGGMSASVKAGIAIAAIGSAVVVFVGAWLVMRRRAKKAKVGGVETGVGQGEMVKGRAGSVTS